MERAVNATSGASFAALGRTVSEEAGIDGLTVEPWACATVPSDGVEPWACAGVPVAAVEPLPSAVIPAEGLLPCADCGVAAGVVVAGIAGCVSEARRGTPAVEAAVGTDADRDSVAALALVLSDSGALLRALRAISSGADCDGSTIAVSSAASTGAMFGAVRRAELMAALPLGIVSDSRRDVFVDSMIEPAMILPFEEPESSYVPRVDEPSGRACTGVMSRARLEAALASTSATAATAEIFFASATATGSANESRLRLRVTSGISAGATGSSLATGAGASSGGTGTPFRDSAGALTGAGVALGASDPDADSRALGSFRLASGAVLASVCFVEPLEITLD